MPSRDDIFVDAREIKDLALRSAYLDEVCGHDLALRGEVEARLLEAGKADGFFGPEETLVSPIGPLREGVGSVVGRYKLLEEIAEGGMGIVYMAEQEEPIRRRVALKIIKLGLDTRSVVARFEAERQALALMDHPNIARVFDGGSTERGRPYFVMELVQGVPITEFCDRNHLAADERLNLFLPVCQAIQHAHQKGIIHRDIKPTNVLVTVHDGVPVPKVIDFGVAKATNQKLTEKTLFTNFGTMIGTPAYMSPEQAEISELDIDTRTDIYALGVLLYQLLTGTTPFPEQRLRALGYGGIQRVILSEDPERPSTRLSTMGDEQRTVLARNCGGETASLNKLLSGDLDWIVMKCLEKDRNRRYETANGLAADIQAHLNNEPVLARPPSTGYRLQKIIRRNKLPVAAAAAVAIALLAGIAATSWQAVRARHAEEEQRRERVRAEARLKATIGFFREAFSSVSPALADIVGAARPRELLANAAASALKELRQGEELHAADRFVLGQLHLQLALAQGWWGGNTIGEYEKAERAITEAIRLFQPETGSLPDDWLMERLAQAELAAGIISTGLLKPLEAIVHHQNSYEWADRVGRQSSSSRLRETSVYLKGWARGNIGDQLIRLDRCEEAITNYFLPELARLRERGNSGLSTNVMDLWDLKSVNELLGTAYYRRGRYADALPYFREARHMIEAINKRQPHSSVFSSALVSVRAAVGEVLLCVNEATEGLQLLRDAAVLADDLASRDPDNPGFNQLQIEVSWRSAAGHIEWANDRSASLSERRARRDEAHVNLNRAQLLLARLKSESLRRFLEADVRRVMDRLAEPQSPPGTSPR